MISRKTRVSSLYQELEDELRKGIQSGKFPEEEQIPSEPELCRHYKLSRTTVRKALLHLADQNMLRRVHGVGTFVVPASERARLARKLARIRVIAPYTKPVIADMDIFDRNVILGVDAFARLHNCILEVASAEEQPERKLLADYHNFLIDGVIWIRANEDELRRATVLRDNHIPQILISRDLPGIPSVYFDSAAAMEDVVVFLQSIGHHKILLIDLASDFTVFHERQKEFMSACKRMNCNGFTGLIPNSYPLDAFRTVLNAHPDATAVICGYPLLPFLMEIVKEKKLHIPDDLSIVQLGSNEEIQRPYYTSISMSLRQIGEKAGALIASLDYRKETSFPRTLVPGFIIVGRTTGLPKIKSNKENLP